MTQINTHTATAAADYFNDAIDMIDAGRHLKGGIHSTVRRRFDNAADALANFYWADLADDTWPPKLGDLISQLSVVLVAYIRDGRRTPDSLLHDLAAAAQRHFQDRFQLSDLADEADTVRAALRDRNQWLRANPAETSGAHIDIPLATVRDGWEQDIQLYTASLKQSVGRYLDGLHTGCAWHIGWVSKSDAPSQATRDLQLIVSVHGVVSGDARVQQITGHLITLRDRWLHQTTSLPIA